MPLQSYSSGVSILLRLHSGAADCGGLVPRLTTLACFWSSGGRQRAPQRSLTGSQPPSWFGTEWRLWKGSIDELSAGSGRIQRFREAIVREGAHSLDSVLNVHSYGSKASSSKRVESKSSGEEEDKRGAGDVTAPTAMDSTKRCPLKEKTSVQARPTPPQPEQVTEDVIAELSAGSKTRRSFGAVEVLLSQLTTKMGMRLHGAALLVKTFPTLMNSPRTAEKLLQRLLLNRPLVNRVLSLADFKEPEPFERLRNFEDLCAYLRENLELNEPALAKLAVSITSKRRILPALTRAQVVALVALLEDINLTVEQIRRALASHRLITLSAESQVKPVLDCLLKAGISKKEVGSIVRRHTQVLLLRSSRIEAKLKWLENLGLSRSQVLKVVKGAPELLGCNLDNMITKKFEWLAKKMGFSKASMLIMLVKDPKMFESNLATIESTIQQFREWGADDAGLRVIMEKMPSVMARKQEALLEKFAFARQVLLKEPKDILASPRYFTSSFQGLIMMRVGFLLSAGLDPTKYALNYLVRSKVAFNKQFGEDIMSDFEDKWWELSEHEMREVASKPPIQLPPFSAVDQFK